MADLPLAVHELNTPIGELLIVSDREGNIRAVDWRDHEERMQRLLRLHYGPNGFLLQPARGLDAATLAIDRYFKGEIGAIDELPIKTGGTVFQRYVWRALRDIPGGDTISYGKLALRIGRPRAIRAVGLANAANPIGIVVPCHRVIGADGALRGYGGGLDRKAWLLAHERAALAAPSESAVRE